MAVNSSFSNDTFLHPNLPPGMYCLLIRPSSLVFTTFYITNILFVLPLYILVLYIGLQRWQHQRSTSTGAMTSHSDSFTYHMVTMELVGVLGCTLSCCGIYRDHVTILTVGYFLWIVTWYGETFFHVLTCVERYLAVIYPVTYLSLRRERGIRIRNISIGCVWLLCFGTTGLLYFDDMSLIWGFIILIVSLIVIAFCSLSLLFVLIRPGPGEQGGDRERVDQSKRRAFYTIMAILGVLLLRFFVSTVWAVFRVLRGSNECFTTMAEAWINVPCSLVLPLLFLHRAGTLACCKNNNQ